MSLFLTLAALVVITWADLPALIKKRDWKELGVYALFWAIGATLSLLLALDVPLPVIASYIAMATHGFLSLFTGGG